MHSLSSFERSWRYHFKKFKDKFYGKGNFEEILGKIKVKYYSSIY